jgi:hypothetical protein
MRLLVSLGAILEGISRVPVCKEKKKNDLISDNFLS